MVKAQRVMRWRVLLLAAGHSVGTTLSPHIDRFNERIRIGGAELSDNAICDAFAEVEAVRNGMSLTYFEYSTLAALWSFREANLDFAILEIGLGGRLDAFNVIDADTAIITSIGYDHQEFLGDTLDEIGREKAGVFRRDQTLILGPDLPESVHAHARALDLDPIVAGEDFDVLTNGPEPWSISGSAYAIESIELGNCAPQNIALACVATIECGAIDHGAGNRHRPQRCAEADDPRAIADRGVAGTNADQRCCPQPGRFGISVH